MLSGRDRKHMKNSYLCIDCETTGLYPAVHEIISICAIRFRFEKNLEIKIEGESTHLVEPKNIDSASREALEINRYDEKLWKRHQVLWPVAWDSIKRISPNTTPMGHGINFDYRFMMSMNSRYKLRFNPSREPIDTKKMADSMGLKRMGLVKSYSLKALCEYFEIDSEQPLHSAKGDVLRTIDLFKELVLMKNPLFSRIEKGKIDEI